MACLLRHVAGDRGRAADAWRLVNLMTLRIRVRPEPEMGLHFSQDKCQPSRSSRRSEGRRCRRSVSCLGERTACHLDSSGALLRPPMCSVVSALVIVTAAVAVVLVVLVVIGRVVRAHRGGAVVV